MVDRRFRIPAWFLCLLMLSFQFGFSAHAMPGAKTGRRLALVIGNSDYENSPLANPVNDAEDIAAALTRTGFEVILRTNAGRRSMDDAVRDFGRRLRNGGVGLFYYAGHGLQIKGRNYLIPVDARIESESDVRYEALDAGRVLGKMEDAGNGLNIVIFDACRDNPFARSFRSGGRKGLAKMDAPVGSLLAYATAPGSVAADGSGRNGLYTSKLLKHILIPGIKIEDVFKQVRREVMAASGDKQVPWESSSMAGDFYFMERVSQKGSTAATTSGSMDRPINNTASYTQSELMLEKQRLEVERQRLEAEKKILAERRRLEEEKRKLDEQRDKLAALQEKIEANSQSGAPPQIAYAHPPEVQTDPAQSYRLALFPEYSKLHMDAGWAKHYMARTIRSVNEKTLDIFLDRKDVRLTDSAIPRDDLGTRAWAIRDLQIVTDQISEKELKAIWHRPSLFSQMVPNLKTVSELGKRIGVDLVMMHKIVRIDSHGGHNYTIYLIDVDRRDVFKELITPSSTSSLKDTMTTLINGFLDKHPLSAKQSG